MFLPGFQWAETADTSPVLAWMRSPSEAFAFLQKGDGSVQACHAPVFLRQGACDLLMPANRVLVPDPMLAWAGTIMGSEGGVRLSYASGMVQSGVGPHDADLEAMSPHLPVQKTDPAQALAAGPIRIGPGSWEGLGSA